MLPWIKGINSADASDIESVVSLSCDYKRLILFNHSIIVDCIIHDYDDVDDDDDDDVADDENDYDEND